MKKYLKISPHSVWELEAVEQNFHWMEKFARFLNLENKTDGDPFKILFRFVVDRSFCDSTIPKSKNVFSNFCIRYPYQQACDYEQKNKTLVCELSEEDNEDLKYYQMWYALFPIYCYYLYKGGLPLHSALAVSENQGYLFAGFSDAGKSTIARRLSFEWRVLNDDETLITYSTEQGYTANPMPTLHDIIVRKLINKCWNVSQHYPIAAILFLEKNHKTEIQELSPSDSALRIYYNQSPLFHNFINQQHQDIRSEMQGMMFNNSCQLAKKIPGYVLRHSLSDDVNAVLNNFRNQFNLKT